MKDDVHVKPVFDRIVHVNHIDCVCAPTISPVERVEGNTYWVYMHHSLDGRELRETA